MSQTPSNLKQPQGSRWDVDFTRLSQVAQRRIGACMLQLGVLLRQAGLQARPGFRVHNAGMSGSLSILGSRGVLASVEFNLVDGMAESRQAGAALEVNLLAGDGEVLAFCSPMRPVGPRGFHTQAADVLATAGRALDANVLYAAVTQHFDLVMERPRAQSSR